MPGIGSLCVSVTHVRPSPLQGAARRSARRAGLADHGGSDPSTRRNEGLVGPDELEGVAHHHGHAVGDQPVALDGGVLATHRHARVGVAGAGHELRRDLAAARGDRETHPMLGRQRPLVTVDELVLGARCSSALI